MGNMASIRVPSDRLAHATYALFGFIAGFLYFKPKQAAGSSTLPTSDLHPSELHVAFQWGQTAHFGAATGKQQYRFPSVRASEPFSCVFQHLVQSGFTALISSPSHITVGA